MKKGNNGRMMLRAQDHGWMLATPAQHCSAAQNRARRDVRTHSKCSVGFLRLAGVQKRARRVIAPAAARAALCWDVIHSWKHGTL